MDSSLNLITKELKKLNISYTSDENGKIIISPSSYPYELTFSWYEQAKTAAAILYKEGQQQASWIITEQEDIVIPVSVLYHRLANQFKKTIDKEE
jgi:hypothetical protein